MKKTVSVISVVIAVSLLFSVFASVVHADGPEYEKRDVTTYVFSLENVKITACVFSSVLPDVPYIDPVDYLSTIYTDEFSQNKNDDGTFTVTAPNGTMIADTVSDTLSFESFEEFSKNNQNREGSSLNINFIKGEEDYYGDRKGLVLDLGKYGIDVIEYDGKIYLPLVTICAMFSVSYSNAEYVDGSIYYLHSMDDTTRDGYFDKSSVYNVLTRSEEMAAFTYGNLCFSIDYFFGKPTNAAISTAIVEKGLDKALEEYDEVTKEAREKLQSTDICDYMAALCVLSLYFSDGGHTVLYIDPLSESGLYPEAAFFNEFVSRVKGGEDPFYAQALSSYLSVAEAGAARAPFTEKRAQAYSSYEPVIKWNDTSFLLVEGDTAVFVFDSFVVDSVSQFKEAVDYAVEHDIKNFIIDVSCNGGGLVAVVYFMMASMLAKRTGSNEFENYSENVTTKNIKKIKVELDLNLDESIDEKDKEVSYDMNFGVLSSGLSFSSGNLLPVLAKEYGIAVIGEKSGGGACAVQKLYFADSHFIFMSSNNKFFVLSGADVDLGAPVDHELVKTNEDGTKDYSEMYGIERLGEILEDYYACKEHVKGEPVKENEVKPTCTKEGTYDEVYYCTVCGEEISRETKHTDPSGHDFGEWVQTKAPTNTEKGEKKRTCSVCGETETEEIPELQDETGKTVSPDTGDDSGIYICVAAVSLVMFCASVAFVKKNRKRAY